MKKRCYNIILCCVSLIIGTTLYIVLRPNTFVAQFFDNLVNINSIRNYFAVFELQFCKYYLPDLLWAFSLCCGLLSIFNVSYTSLVWCSSISFVYGLTWEILQHLNITKGVFDFFDIAMYLIAVILSVLLNIKGLSK